MKSKLSLKKKIFILSGIFVVLTVGYSFLLIKSSFDRTRGLETVYSMNMVPMMSLFKISNILKDIPFKMALYSMGELPAAGTKNKLSKDAKELDLMWNRFTKAYKSRKHEKKIDAIFTKLNKKYKSFREFVPRLLKAYQKDDSETVMEILEDEWPVYQVTLAKNITKLGEYFRSSTLNTYHEGNKAADFYYFFSMILGIISFGIVVYMAYFLTMKIATPISYISEQLAVTSDEFIGISGELFKASQIMAESSSEQAASIEETSSSLEELYGMVETNVSISQKACDLSRSVNQDASTSGENMKNLVNSMEEVLESNNSIQELVNIISEIGVKTQLIDEIVFQTKLLSFNASVEAERAGEHGRGFAVVAHEVGKLAQMSGNAANEIASIVKESILKSESVTSDNRKKVSEGNELVKKTADLFKQVLNDSRKLDDSSKNILTASKEQLVGLKQITTAMSQLDSVTQRNYQASLDTSNSSANIKDKASNLGDIIVELNLVV